MATMEQERPPPPSYNHDPASLHLPSVPLHQVSSGPRTNNGGGVHLPELRSLGLPQHNRGMSTPDAMAKHQSPFAFSDSMSPPPRPLTSSIPHALADAGSPMAVASVLSADDQRSGAELSVSMEDADVRMAAEALSGLGNPDFARSPPTTTFSPLASSAVTPRGMASPMRHSQSPQAQQKEPLLRLLTTSHPWLGSTISGSMYAYDGAKHYSPSFVRGTAEFVERNIGNPMVNTVGFVSRQTGVDTRIRRYLNGSRRRRGDEVSSDTTVGGGHKRRRVMSGERMDEDLEQGLANIAEEQQPRSPRTEQRMRTASQSSLGSAMSLEQLPAYDDQRSPRYEEVLSPPPSVLAAGLPEDVGSPQQQQQHLQQRNWPTQILVTTSGLGVALSESSLRSLKYSLGVLRTASDQIGSVMSALRLVLDEYMQVQQETPIQTIDEKTHYSEKNPQMDTRAELAMTSSAAAAAADERSRALAARIQGLGDNIWAVLRSTIATISQYTGSALPDNAASLVRRQLMSLPQRWRSAATSSSSEPSSRTGSSAGVGTASTPGQQEGQTVMAANRIMNFGKESLDMLSQVSLVVSGTLQSAEEWLDSLGRGGRQRQGQQEVGAQQQQQVAEFQGQPMMVAGQVWHGGEKKDGLP